ncbi:MAG TPA: methylmalonyl-CoA mutase, partial [Brevibacillus sp.]|nr:methylmalonyl-CoA mutase [Brevibacillus sp.]
MSDHNFTQIYQDWQQRLNQRLEKIPERKKRFSTSSDLEVEQLYLPKEVNQSYMDQIGLPGECPYNP